MAKRCKACGGCYEPILPDGSPYFHVCPPITLVAVQRGGKAQRVPLAELQPDDRVRVRRGTQLVTAINSELEPDDVRIGDDFIERENRRDERPIERVVNGKVEGRPAAEGAGVEDVVIEAPTPADIFESDVPLVP